MDAQFEKNYWNQRYLSGGNSGYGSYGEQLAKKIAWLAPLDFNTITEIGCGDFNFGSTLLEKHPAIYTGYDISDVVVERNRKLFPEHFFYSMTSDLIKSDLLLCIDVMFHIIQDKEAEEMLKILENNWTKYLAITAYERHENLGNHVRIRKFEPSRFGVPIIREIVEADGDLYFYLFKK